MTDDKSLVDAYASIYNKKEKEIEQVDEAIFTGAALAGKALLGAGKKFLMNKAKDAAVGMAKRGVGMLNPKKQEAQAEQLANAYASIYKEESIGKALDKGLSAGADTLKATDKAVEKGSTFAKRLGRRTAQTLATPIGVVKSAIQGAKKGAQAEEVTHEDVAITHLDGSTTEIIDVVTPPPLGNKEADQEALHNRLWDQVTANLTTLGEMDDTRYLVEPLDEKKKLDAVGQEDDDVDNDGDVDDSDSYLKKRRDAIGKAMGKKGKKDDEDEDEDKEEKKSEKKETKEEYTPKFNVRSQVAFSTPEEVVEEGISDEQFNAFAPSIAEAHRKIYRD